MAQVKEYYPSLTIDDYKLGEIYMFIRNVTVDSKKISSEHMNYISEKKLSDSQSNTNKKGGLAPDSSGQAIGGLAPDNNGQTIGGLEPDNDPLVNLTGGLEPDTGKVRSNLKSLSRYNKENKLLYGKYSYEAGKIIGINKLEGKLYVQFEDTEKDHCHIFKAGIASDQFDMIEKLIRKNGHR